MDPDTFSWDTAQAAVIKIVAWMYHSSNTKHPNTLKQAFKFFQCSCSFQGLYGITAGDIVLLLFFCNVLSKYKVLPKFFLQDIINKTALRNSCDINSHLKNSLDPKILKYTLYIICSII